MATTTTGGGPGWRLASVVGCVLLLALVAGFGADAGVTWDEPLQAEYGNRVLRWFASGFTDLSAMDYRDLFLYGGLFDAVAQWVAHRSSAELYVVRHMLTALLAFVGIVATGVTAATIGGPRAGFLAGAVLALTPPWIGHGLFNPKDIPFGAAVAVVGYSAVRLASGTVPPRRRDVLFAGFAVGIALAIRPGGVFVAAYPFVAGGAAVLANRPPAGHDRRWLTWLRVGGTTAVRLLPVIPIAWVLMLAAWPWAQLAPFTRPYVAMAAAQHFRWDGVMLFGGATVPATSLPGSYLPTWFALTTPETYPIALLLGVFAIAWNRGGIRPSAVAAFVAIVSTIVIPVVGVIYTRPVLYDGLRHFLFLFPTCAVVAGLAISGFIASRVTVWIRAAGVAAMALSGCVVLYDIVSLHPYEYVYFNRVSGGLKAASGRYETDYWGASYKEGLVWALRNFVGPHPDHVIPISSCDFGSNPRLEHYREAWPGVKERIAIVEDYSDAEVYLGVTRYDCHERPGVVMHTVSRQGVPLLYVIRIPPRR